MYSVRPHINTDTDTDGVFVSPQHFGKFKFASSGEGLRSYKCGWGEQTNTKLGQSTELRPRHRRRQLIPYAMPLCK
jgi:hypothetical protein